MAKPKKIKSGTNNSKLVPHEPVYTGKKKKYYEILIELRDQMIDEMRILSGYSLSTNKQAGEELADIGSDNFIREMELSLLTEEGRKLQAILEAIERLKSGSFGTCIECGKKILEGRLEAIPYAKLCISCKSKAEKSALDRAPDSERSFVAQD